MKYKLPLNSVFVDTWPTAHFIRTQNVCISTTLEDVSATVLYDPDICLRDALTGWFFFLLLFVCLMHIGGNLWVFNPRQSFKADQYISAI